MATLLRVQPGLRAGVCAASSVRGRVAACGVSVYRVVGAVPHAPTLLHEQILQRGAERRVARVVRVLVLVRLAEPAGGDRLLRAGPAGPALLAPGGRLLATGRRRRRGR